MNKKKIYPQWFLILPLALYIIFFLLPSIMGVAYSFTDWNSRSVLNGVHFVELDNFKEIFTSNKDYLSGIGNTLKFTIISNIVKLIPALLIAIMLQEGLKGKGLYRTLLYLPSILPFVIIGLVFKSILNYNNGLLNAILDGLHLGKEHIAHGAAFKDELQLIQVRHIARHLARLRAHLVLVGSLPLRLQRGGEDEGEQQHRRQRQRQKTQKRAQKDAAARPVAVRAGGHLPAGVAAGKGLLHATSPRICSPRPTRS